MTTDTPRNELADSRGPNGEWLFPELRNVVDPVANPDQVASVAEAGASAEGEAPPPAAPAGAPTLLKIAE